MTNNEDTSDESVDSFQFLADDASSACDPPTDVSAPPEPSCNEQSGKTASLDEQQISVAEPTGSFAPTGNTVRVSRQLYSVLIGYGMVLTGLLLTLLITGRIAWSPQHPLESLPDLRPLLDNEFRRVPADAGVADQHVVRLGESRRFGDVVVTPTKVTHEPLEFEGFLSGNIDASLTTNPVLKLWLRFENVASDYAFPPFDASLMASRSPRDGVDTATEANSFLQITTSSDAAVVRVLNYLHLPESNFCIVGQNAGTVIPPGESMTTFLASAESAPDLEAADATDCRWRVQFRKGVSQSENGVTTLVDVLFASTEIESTTQPE
jgi:hypothetical protein